MSHPQFPKSIAVVTVARSDYSILRPVMRAIERHPSLSMRLMVTGMHLAAEFGLTVQEIDRDGFHIADRIPMLLSSDRPEAIAASMGLGTIGFAQAFARSRPDLLLVTGDRVEMHAAAVAAVPFTIPIAHLHGGESTEGAIDDALRHSITKLSHLHFAATPIYAARLRQMGEERWRVSVSGAPALDTIREIPRLTRDDLRSLTGLTLERPFLVVTLHPVTLEYDSTEWHVEELLTALQSLDRGIDILFTYPNADTNGRVIIDKIKAWISGRSNAQAVANLGASGYYSALELATAMVGNSSSGIIEAASFKLPVVNVGNRQRGRLAPPNVIHCGHHRDEIVEALRRACSEEFKSSLAKLENPYGDSHAADRIVSALATVELNDRLLMKRTEWSPDEVLT